MISAIKNHWIKCHASGLDKNIRTEVYNSLEEIKVKWNELLPPSHHLQSDSLMVIENACLDDLEFKYILVYDEKEILGCVYLQLLKFNSKHYNHQVLEKPQYYLIKSFVLKQSINLLVCGNLFRIDFQGFYFKNEKNESLIFDIVSNYCKHNEEEKTFCGMLIKDCNRAIEPMVVQDKRFQPFRDDITMELYVRKEWLTFDDYLKSLSRKYLQRAKKILKAGNSIERRVLSLDEIIYYSEDIHKLYMQVASKQSIRMGLLKASYFVEMQKYYQNNFKIVGYFDGSQMVGFSSYICYDTYMEIHFIGFDYHYNEVNKVYFNILFDGIKEAITNKYGRIELGRTAKEAKASAGAVSVDIYNYIKLKHGLPSIAFSFFNGLFNSNVGESWKARNPFKEIS
ncbi:MAG: hypothetical protein HYZ42_06770 [Bacteroidetes bacterium]|nr:hypothetical protein [Bacteroidota bacterium]